MAQDIQGQNPQDNGIERGNAGASSQNGMERPKSVHIHDVRELRYWTKTLGISSDALVSAVRAVGNDPAKVEEYIRQRRAS